MERKLLRVFKASFDDLKNFKQVFILNLLEFEMKTFKKMQISWLIFG